MLKKIKTKGEAIMTVEAWQLRGPEQAAKREFSNHPQEAEREPDESGDSPSPSPVMS